MIPLLVRQVAHFTGNPVWLRVLPSLVSLVYFRSYRPASRLSSSRRHPTNFTGNVVSIRSYDRLTRFIGRVVFVGVSRELPGYFIGNEVCWSSTVRFRFS